MEHHEEGKVSRANTTKNPKDHLVHTSRTGENRRPLKLGTKHLLIGRVILQREQTGNQLEGRKIVRREAHPAIQDLKKHT